MIIAAEKEPLMAMTFPLAAPISATVA